MVRRPELSACYRRLPCRPAYWCSVAAAAVRLGAGEEGFADDLRAARAWPACRCRGSMSAKLMPSGTSNGDARAAGERALHELRSRSAAPPATPLRPTGWLSSNPTQTTVSSSGVKPTNQASRRSLVVPVLPAASSVKPARARAGAGALVHHAAHHVGHEERRVRPRDLPRRWSLAFLGDVLAAARDRAGCAAAAASTPMFGKIV